MPLRERVTEVVAERDTVPQRDCVRLTVALLVTTLAVPDSEGVALRLYVPLPVREALPHVVTEKVRVGVPDADRLPLRVGVRELVGLPERQALPL